MCWFVYFSGCINKSRVSFRSVFSIKLCFFLIPDGNPHTVNCKYVEICAYPDALWYTAIYSYSDLSRPLGLVVSLFVKKVIYVLVVNPVWLLYLHRVCVLECVCSLGVKHHDSCKRPQNDPPFILF